MNTAARPAAHPAVAVARGAILLWRFSRPHTLAGTTISIAGIYVIAAATLPALALGEGLGDLAFTLLAGWCVNVAIVGINQLEDVAIDRVNKPWLPLASGELATRAARRIVVAATVVPLVLALTQGAVELAAVSLALAIGAAYSVPPLRLKRRPVVACASIATVRALVVNLGVYLHFARSLGGEPALAPVPGPIWALTVFIVPFAVAIALLKDVPDAEGDRRFAIATFTVRLGPRPVFAAGMAALTAAYAGMALAAPFVLDGAGALVMGAGHLAALALLWRWAVRVPLDDPAGFTSFYMRVWALLFAEYVLVPVAVLAA